MRFRSASRKNGPHARLNPSHLRFARGWGYIPGMTDQDD
jgi:hypothetical protein